MPGTVYTQLATFARHVAGMDSETLARQLDNIAAGSNLHTFDETGILLREAVRRLRHEDRIGR